MSVMIANYTVQNIIALTASYLQNIINLTHRLQWFRTFTEITIDSN